MGLRFYRRIECPLRPEAVRGCIIATSQRSPQGWPFCWSPSVGTLPPGKAFFLRNPSGKMALHGEGMAWKFNLRLRISEAPNGSVIRLGTATGLWIGVAFVSILVLATLGFFLWPVSSGPPDAFEIVLGACGAMVLLIITFFGCFHLWLIHRFMGRAEAGLREELGRWAAMPETSRVALSPAPEMYCRGCNLDLRGIAAGVRQSCPECGRGFDSPDEGSFRRRPIGGAWGTFLRLHPTRADRVCAWVGIICFLNFVAFFFISIALGGDALSGRVQGGHYYLSSHGHLTEVSRNLWYFSLIDTIGALIIYPLGTFGSVGLIVLNRWRRRRVKVPPVVVRAR